MSADLLILGAGPGGYVAAIRAAQLGLKVILIEAQALGGTCLWRGCIPTKCLLEVGSRHRWNRKEARRFGLKVSSEFDWGKVQSFKERTLKQNARGIDSLLKQNGVQLLKGRGCWIAPGQLQVQSAEGEKILEAPQIILATGSRVLSLPNLPFDGQHLLSSDELLEIPQVPKRLNIIGGGVVGVEFASLFESFGSKVQLFELEERLLPSADPEISQHLLQALKRRGIRCHLGVRCRSTEPCEGGIKLHTDVGEHESDLLLLAVGRRPNTEELGLEESCAQLKGGYLEVDALGRTGEPGLWAIGDIVSGSPQLAHVASAEGLRAAEAIAGLKPGPIAAAPSAVYTEPQLAWIGLTEPEALGQGHELLKSAFPFAAVPKARIMGKPEGLIKVIAEAKQRKILGIHIIGPHASDLLGEAGALLGRDLEEAASLIHAHPSLSEGLGEALHMALGRAIHI